MREMECVCAELEKQLMELYPEIKKLSIQAGMGTSTRELVDKSLEKLEVCGQGRLERDCYGAPWYAGRLEPTRFVSISSTEDRGRRLCLTAVHDREISGIGIDYALTEEFTGMFDQGQYCGGRMFTDAEQAWLKKAPCTGEEGQRLLAELFSGKEAALKSLSNIIREKIPEDQAKGRRMEFKEFEIREDAAGKRKAVPFGRTAETAAFLCVKEITVVTRALWEGAVSVAACFCR